MKPAILALRGLGAGVPEGLAEHFTVHRPPGGDLDGLARHIGQEVRAIATGGSTELPGALIDRLPALEIVACYGVGYEAIDAAALARRGIVVTHTPGVLDDEVANTAIALLLAVTRRIVAHDRYVREGRWLREGNAPLTHGLAGRTIAIAGLGRIGLAIAGKLAVFGCRVVYHSRRPRADVALAYYADLTAMARDADVLIAVLPGGDGTRNLIGRAVLDALGPQGTFINVGRGTVVDEAQLVAALAEGRLGAAGLDVFADEPHVPAELIGMDNVVLLPHVGSATVETREAMGRLLIDNLLSWYKDRKALTPVPECRHMQE